MDWGVDALMYTLELLHWGIHHVPRLIAEYQPIAARAKLDPDYPRLPYGNDAKRSMIAKATFTREGVRRTSFLPVIIDKQLRPEVIAGADPRFEDAVQYMRWASEDFNRRFTIAGDEVVVTSA